jgi:seryl-tRNA synthetase
VEQLISDAQADTLSDFYKAASRADPENKYAAEMGEMDVRVEARVHGLSSEEQSSIADTRKSLDVLRKSIESEHENMRQSKDWSDEQYKESIQRVDDTTMEALARAQSIEEQFADALQAVRQQADELLDDDFLTSDDDTESTVSSYLDESHGSLV